jgi:hypothetical protein
VETSLTDPAVPDEEDALPARPAYAWAIEKRLDALSDFERDILERRFLADNPETLEEIGTDCGLTRERVRQIEARALGCLAGDPEPKTGRPRKGLTSAEGRPVATKMLEADAVQKAVTQLRELHLPVTEAGLVEAGVEPLDSTATRLLIVIAKKAAAFCNGRPVVIEHAGRRWLAVGNQTPEKLVRDLTEAACGTGVVTDLVELWSAIEEALRPHVGSDEEAAHLTADVVEGLGLEEIGGQYAVLGGAIGVVDRLARILRANGAPMDRNLLLGYFLDRSERTVLNALFELPFVRVGRDDFALEEWGATPRPQLRDLLYDELDRHGQVAVSYLADLAAEYEYSRASIFFYSSLPDVIEEAGVLRRRRPDDPPAVPEPGLNDRCFRVVAGPHRGCWASMVVVSHRRLYHGPQWIPTPLAELLDIEPGSRRVPVTVNGATVHASWGQSPYLFGGELRPVLDALGFADGELIRFVATDPGALLAEKMPVVTGPDTPFRTLVTGACLYDGAGAPVPDSGIAEALAYAIGLDAATPLPIVERRLGTRHNQALRDALGLIFPEVRAK